MIALRVGHCLFSALLPTHSALVTRCDSVLVSTRLRVALLMRLASADACFAAFGATGFMVHLGSA